MMDLGLLTEEETVQLLERVLENVTEEKLFVVLNNFLSQEQKLELAETWYPTEHRTW